ncbi:MAG: hypothetical protein HQ518_09360 [Rhodopirellula sp.]|nr:hypothetical protein [Rhodopirellula sp.]
MVKPNALSPSLFARLLIVLTSVQMATVTAFAAESPEPAEFVVWSDTAGFSPPQIVVPFDSDADTGVNRKLAADRPWYDRSEAKKLGDAIHFLREGVEKMCGRRLGVVNSNDLSRGIILTTLSGAGDDIRNDAAVQAALRSDGSDDYNHREAFLIRSEPQRLLIVANTIDGLVCAVPELLESVGYEVLAMGPNWVHVPDGFQKRMSFQINRAERPTYYIRGLVPTSGQSYGVGTILDEKRLNDPADETVTASYRRWAIGRRLKTQSMPGFPGHAMQAHHRALIAHIRETGDTYGFLGTVKLDDESQRPTASDENRDWLWINSHSTAAPNTRPAFDGVFRSDGKEWKPANLEEVGLNLDLSVPTVRAIIFNAFKERSEAHFKKSPAELFVFGTDPEDGGGYTRLAELLKHPNWYPQYLAETGRDFGRPYVLHQSRGLDQPRELWDANAPSDIVFGFNNWLLAEYDRWLESLPTEQRVTSTGRGKRDAVRCSLYSYNFHDVPPNFNVDPRVRVMIASYPKHRGRGKWKAFASQTDLAQAFGVMLPREPSGDYWIISLSYYWDRGIDGLEPPWNASPEFLARRQHDHYAAGFRALSVETDFNFGRLGLGYYLMSQLLWDTRLTTDELDAIRDRWLQRSFGSGWPAMKQYYDYMLTSNYPVNSPYAWARAIRFIDEADGLIDSAVEPAAQRRLDDLKQYWYFYYLVDTGEDKPSSDAMRELLWKGQMSYANASHVIARRIFSTSDAVAASGDFSQGPAHYTEAETAAWWSKVLDHWPLVDVSRFADATLADGTPARNVDLHDLVAVKEFGDAPCPQAFLYNAGYQKQPTFRCAATRAGEEIGFQIYWPADPTGKDGYYIARDLPYGISVWNAEDKVWESLVDMTLFKQPSVEVQLPGSERRHHLVTVRYSAPRPGTYRFEIGYGGNLSFLTDLGFDHITGQHTSGRSLTFDSTGEGLTQTPSYIYIPKGTQTLDLEVWDSYGAKTVTLYKRPSAEHPGLLAPSPANISRKVDISARQTHRIALEPDETGTIAMLSGNGFAFPYLYSVPLLWSKSPAQLLVPRHVAAADDLTVRD